MSLKVSSLRAKEIWFQKFLALPNGIPSHDTFRRVFLRINPKKFQEAFLSWVRSVVHQTEGELVSIDGKRCAPCGDIGGLRTHCTGSWMSRLEKLDVGRGPLMRLRTWQHYATSQ